MYPSFHILRFNKRSKDIERQVLGQGITLSSPPMTASTPLPPARTLPPELPSGVTQQHEFTLPCNAAGAAKTTRRSGNILPNQMQCAPALRTFCAILPNPGTSTTQVETTMTPVTIAEPQIPASMLCYRRKREQQGREGNVTRKRYNRKAGTTCRQCGEERSAESHRQYYGSWWCKKMSDIDFEVWVGKLKEQGKGRRKNLDKE